jgi:hypothetical protein
MCNSRASQKPVRGHLARASDTQKLTDGVRISEQSADSFCGVWDDDPKNLTVNRSKTKNRSSRVRFTWAVHCWFFLAPPMLSCELIEVLK